MLPTGPAISIDSLPLNESSVRVASHSRKSTTPSQPPCSCSPSWSMPSQGPGWCGVRLAAGRLPGPVPARGRAAPKGAEDRAIRSPPESALSPDAEVPIKPPKEPLPPQPRLGSRNRPRCQRQPEPAVKEPSSPRPLRRRTAHCIARNWSDELTEVSCSLKRRAGALEQAGENLPPTPPPSPSGAASGHPHRKPSDRYADLLAIRKPPCASWLRAAIQPWAPTPCAAETARPVRSAARPAAVGSQPGPGVPGEALRLSAAASNSATKTAAAVQTLRWRVVDRVNSSSLSCRSAERFSGLWRHSLFQQERARSRRCCWRRPPSPGNLQGRSSGVEGSSRWRLSLRVEVVGEPKQRVRATHPRGNSGHVDRLVVEARGQIPAALSPRRAGSGSLRPGIHSAVAPAGSAAPASRRTPTPCRRAQAAIAWSSRSTRVD